VFFLRNPAQINAKAAAYAQMVKDGEEVAIHIVTFISFRVSGDLKESNATPT
jgi:hypothetical protein